MITPSPASWTVRGATFTLWLLAAACATYWGLKLGRGPAVVAPAAQAARPAEAVDPAAIARLLGGTAPALVGGQAPSVAVASLASRFTLVGVAAGAYTGAGAAVIAVDGKPARPFRVGSMVDEGLMLQSVQGRRALLGAQRNGPTVLTLELPATRKS